MKRLHIITILFFLTLESSGQDGQLTTMADTVRLLDFAQRFGKAVNSNDVHQIRAMSLDNVYCRVCIGNPIPPKTSEYFFTPMDTFLDAAYRESVLNKLWKVIKDKSEMINSYTLEKPFRQKELKGLNQIIIFEVFFTTLKRDGYEKGHEGQQTALQFVKLGDNFKFYGIDTVP